MFNKNTIKNLFSLVLLVFALSACKKNTAPQPEPESKVVFANNMKTSVDIKTDQTLILNPTIKGCVTKYEWVEAGQVIGTEAIYVFNRDVPGEYTITLNASNAAGTSSLNYKIKVIGIYADGVLLISGTDKNGTGAGNISYLDEYENLKLDVFSKENSGSKLSSSIMGAFRYGNQLYLSASKTPFIQIVNNETLKLDATSITTASVTGINYFATTDGKTGYVLGGSGTKRGFYSVDLTAKTIGSTLLTGTTSAALLPITVVNNAYLAPVAKTLVKVENGTAQTLFTYPENAAGMVKTSNKQIWVGVAKGSSPKAKMVRLDENLTVQETVGLESNFLLPPNGILTASGTSEFIYWQETATGDFCRFNTTTKTAEKFVSPANDGLTFATAWKVNPKTGELYIADTPGLFTFTDSVSDLYIYGTDKKLRKKITNAGYQIVDVIFPK